jgi:hypothetical protein
MIAKTGDLTQMDDKTTGNTNDMTSRDVSKSGSCIEVDGDEEWIRDNEEMEEEDRGDRVMINQEGDITNRYFQMITTRPDWITDHKVIGTGPVTTPLNTNGKTVKLSEFENYRAINSTTGAYNL